MVTRISFALALSGLLLGTGLGRADPDQADKSKPKPPTAEEIQKGQKHVDAYLADVKGQAGQVKPIDDEAVRQALPGCLCYAVLFKQYSVGRLPPAPLKVANVLVVKDDKVTAVTDAKELEKFCKTNLAPVKTEAAAREAIQAWLRLSEDLHQDGFFEFTVPEKSLKVTPEKFGLKAGGKAVVEPKGGNKGEINATLAFDADGKLTGADEEAKVVAGIRPKCQATKLLDPDPVVRAMAEQDILVMGRMGKSYLDEQRAKASPEVQKIIDRLWQRIVEEGR
jgi:hypothetical protein